MRSRLIAGLFAGIVAFGAPLAARADVYINLFGFNPKDLGHNCVHAWSNDKAAVIRCSGPGSFTAISTHWNLDRKECDIRISGGHLGAGWHYEITRNYNHGCKGHWANNNTLDITRG